MNSIPENTLSLRRAMVVDDALAGKRPFKPWPVVGHVPFYRGRTFFDVFREIGDAYGPFTAVRLPKARFHIATNAAVCEHLADETLFEKRIEGALAEVARIAGKGLFTVEGNDPLWERARKVLSAGFHAKAMQRYHVEMRERVVGLLAHWEARRLSGDALVSPVDDFTRLTLEIIARCGFGYELALVGSSTPHPFVEALGEALVEAGERLKRPAFLSFFSRHHEARFQQNLATLSQTVDACLDARLANPSPSAQDLLQLMLDAKDDEGREALPRENIREQLLTFLIAGHETTSGLLSFATALLAAHPSVVAGLRAEVLEVLGGRAPEELTFQDTLKLRYVQAVLNETLRLWPTAPTFSVSARRDTKVETGAGGPSIALKAGERIVVSLWHLHRDPAIWGPDAEAFRPERFLVPSDAIPKHAYKPFGNGKRSCIGRFFALHEATIALALLFVRYDVGLVEGYPFRIQQQLTIKPASLRVRLTPRGEGRAAPALTSGGAATTTVETFS